MTKEELLQITNDKLVEKCIGSWVSAMEDIGPVPPLEVRQRAKNAHTQFKAELLRRLGAAVSASPQPRPWFPIATAPKDGRHIQAADFRPGQVGFGGNPQQAYQCIVHWFEWGDGTHTEESGFYPSTGAGENPPLTNLTHWKPLEEFFAAAPAQEPEIGLKEHLAHVQQFLNDLWAYSIDPLHEGMEGLKVAEVCDALLKAAKDNRDREYAQEQPVENSPQKENS